MALTALLRYDGKQIQLELNSTQPLNTDTLLLQVIHSTRAELDRSLTLQREGDLYRAKLEGLVNGNWYLRLKSPEADWEIRNRIIANGPFQTLLTAQDN